MMVKVKELTVEQLKALIEETVAEKLQEILGDPDEGLELREDVREKLKDSLSAMGRGEKGIPIGQIAKEIGIELE